MTKQRLFSYHWLVLGGATIGLALGHAPVLMYTFIVFLKPLATEFGWQRGTTASISSLAVFTLAMVLPLFGSIVDRFGARRVLIPSIVGLGLVTMSISLLPGSLWAWYAVFILIVPIVAAGSGAVAYTRVLTAWFDRRRGMALGIAISGVGLGTMIFPPLAQTLIDAYSWRVAYLVLGGIVIAVGLPVVLLTIRNTPEEMGLAADHGVLEEGFIPLALHKRPGLNVKEARGQRSFWILGTAIFLIGMSIVGAVLHLSAIFTDRGVSPLAAASLIGVLGASSMVSRIVVGLLFDRFFAPRIVVLFTITASLAALLLASGTSDMRIGILSAILLGVAFGAEIDMIGYLSSRYFGVRHYATIYGIFLAIFQFGAGLGPVVVGYAFDMLGSYTVALHASAVGILVACFFLLLLGPYPEFGRVGAATQPET